MSYRHANHVHACPLRKWVRRALAFGNDEYACSSCWLGQIPAARSNYEMLAILIFIYIFHF